MGTSRENSELANSTEATGRHWTVAMPGKRMSEIILDDSLTTDAYQVSEEVDVWKSSRVYIYATIVAVTLGDQVSFVPELSGGTTPDPSEFMPLFEIENVGVIDLPSSPSTFYDRFNFNTKTIRPQEFRSAASDGVDTIKIGFFVDVLGARKLRVRFRGIVVGATVFPNLELKVFKAA